jgi:ATP-dependent helicase Lhr and Lhr-like helicase
MSHRDDNFQMLHREMQEQLYHMHWRELRPIQSSAIKQIIAGDGHLIISARTAGGKTEAAFLPILSLILDDHSVGVRAIYVGPLKALINDQFRRLEDLCQRSGIPVHKWHGDVSAAAKKELRKNPSGLLLITPESIESLFINYPDRIDDMFKRLAFVVVDELHSFLGTERGAHLLSLLTRLVSRSQLPVRLVALSATFGQAEGVQAARNWLSIRDTDRVAEIVEASGRRSMRYQVKGYLRVAKVDETATPESQQKRDSSEPEVTDDDRHLVENLFDTFRETTSLVFANNKSQLEFNADQLRRHCERVGIRNPFRVHHGSLSKSEREETERLFGFFSG